MKLLRVIVASCLTLLGVSLAAVTIFTPAPAGTAATHHHQARPVIDEALPAAGLDRILAAIRCERPQTQVDAAELHGVSCRSAADRYIVMTFATRAGEDEWLSEAESYGGTYLVGDRWTVVSASKLLSGLRARLGGHIEGPVESHRH
ncbi:hypothetical protein [Nonomuraea zeae]|uniref:Lipoprotein n=1 Tax=Nonomuraea zeae TaxID=1642303 RepID=A0A5S4GZD8_9ACTN|nr:hypothetical protein [Nonomuraea zeae]TMR37901.1 hypothetical protein ETD85_06660 [Nonomuraea zeae]